MQFCPTKQMKTWKSMEVYNFFVCDWVKDIGIKTLPDKYASFLLGQNQLILLDTLDQEVTKFRECNALLDLNSLFTEAKIYHNKLVNIRKEMILLHERTTKLKKRALKLQQQKQKEALEKEHQREKELERERQLTAKPAKRT
ncbi:biogenesis of lysosome-related organelles complex 1 subunit 6-like isoform X2 [Entelurus aequoreus]|uniref:biogenesis of lysosome-related organelles complex 1 subunit 6-like isoform X2 n=1 Tax=Entelurus aequoreus TaxID=161455 RepID=UPI002B1D2424|nr:biogenesis of lysosome-related organelles complex 1 subunit 6-like isoform X2 [Entelurus aequoreus]XP_061889976.1 biogenesis of lysosome-related organelles complex 1 subunit 6-like isoform X2 [Entelurus aequoreus]